MDVEEFKQPQASENTVIKVKAVNISENLADGDCLENSQKVTVTITPDTGYCVTGNNVKNGIYSATMSYADYLKKIDSIIANHPAEKMVLITLDTSDDYASYAYKLDDRSVSGTIYAQVGQKLKLDYEITDSAYTLAKAHGGLSVLKWGSSTTKASETITVTAEMDNTTITKADFDIETVKEG